ncbi:unnamed protein product [Adineta ricciae]|uniref:Uncharacterized protein n=1 Tax=Adineta ricciae TaxID=249248 RepID=A0A815GRG3_ADIRI|nr:unnamed protein product [Adineta ricciae]CAF1409035.1 unnamed protein product [Adineta ricciae]
MDSNGGHYSGISSRSSRKRRSSRQSNSSSDRRGFRADSRSEFDSQRLEENFNRMRAEFQAIKAENQDLKSKVRNLQEEQGRLRSQNRELESRICQVEQRSPSTNSDASHSITIPDLDQLAKDFDERCYLVESNNKECIERIDSCQQNFAKISHKTETIESQLATIQQRLVNVEVQDKEMQENETTVIQQYAANGEYEESNEDAIRIEKALCTPCEKQIELPTDEIQYGVFDVCDKYNVILLKDDKKLRLFDHEKQIDERPWGEPQHNNFATCIHWCSFMDCFLVLYRYRLYTLSLEIDQQTPQVKFGDFIYIKSIHVYSLKYDVTQRCSKAAEFFRFITTSPGLPDYLFLNRGYRRIELINTNSWMMKRGWSKVDLDYEENDEIRLITLNLAGTYLAMNIRCNDRVEFVDLRKYDDQLTLMKRIPKANNSFPLDHRMQIPFGRETWLVINDKNQCYKISADPNDKSMVPIRTDEVQAIENVSIRMRFVCNNTYLLVGAVTGNSKQKQGVLKFYKIPA